MTSTDIGEQYDQLAKWWQEHHVGSDYGGAQVSRALALSGRAGRALDVGCGAGGRLVNLVRAAGYHLTGVDASAEMIALAKESHPDCAFTQANICDWETPERFDFVLAWDCLFHLPLEMQAPILRKLCGLLNTGGTLIYTFGDDMGAHQDEWRGQTFAYSSIGITRNIELLHESGMMVRHFELDQYPEKHAYLIANKA